MADNKNIDESAEKRKKARIEKNIENLNSEIISFFKLQKFSLAEFKRSDSYKKYTSLETYIPETNKSVGADVARLLLGRFKEKKRRVALKDENGDVVRDSEGNRVLLDPSDNSFKARLKRSGLTSFGRYISDDKEGIGYDILRTVVGRFSDDFNKKKKSLERNEKKLSTLEGGKRSSSLSQNDSADGSVNSPSVIGINPKDTETIISSIKDSSDKILDSTDELTDLSKRTLVVEKKLLEFHTKKGATELEKELEKKKTFEEMSGALKGIQKNVKNAVNLTTKSTGGASGEGSIIDNIADLTTIGALGKGVFGKIGGAFGSIFGKIKGFGTSTVGMLKYGAQVGTNKALPLLHSVKDSAKSVGTNILEKGKTVGANILEKGKGLLESGKSAINNIPTPKILDLAKKGGIIGAGITAISSIFDINKASDEIDEKVKSGVISKEDANRAKLNSAIEIGSKGAGGAIGGLVGMSEGAALGATLGSVVPVLGTGVGAVLGGLIGGFGGEKIGSWLGGFFGDSVTNDVKENKSFEERFEELEERRKTFSGTNQNRRAVLNELFEKKMSERQKIVPIEKLMEISLATGESMESLLRKEQNIAWKEAHSEIGNELRNRRADWEKDKAILEDEFRKSDSEGYKAYKEREEGFRRQVQAAAKRGGGEYAFIDLINPKEKGISSVSPNNISPSNKNLEGAKMVNESEVANYKEKQRQAKSDKASDNVINNNVHTEVKNQTVQNRQLKPRSDHSIYERLHGSD